jgi:hypothetical protein
VIFPLVDSPTISRVTLAALLEPALHGAVQATNRVLGGDELTPTPQSETRPARSNDDSKRDASDRRLDEEVKESFPASDPPSILRRQ